MLKDLVGGGRERRALHDGDHGNLLQSVVVASLCGSSGKRTSLALISGIAVFIEGAELWVSIHCPTATSVSGLMGSMSDDSCSGEVG